MIEALIKTGNNVWAVQQPSRDRRNKRAAHLVRYIVQKEFPMSLQELKRAIKEQKPVSFTYNKQGKTPGERVGNPHAIWVMRKKDGAESTKVHIVQVSGVSDSAQAFPSFRMFDLSEIDNVSVIDGEPQFEISEQYNPEWSGYTFVIAKI